MLSAGSNPTPHPGAHMGKAVVKFVRMLFVTFRILPLHEFLKLNAFGLFNPSIIQDF